MFLSLFHTLRHRYQLRQTINALQRRADDRLLDDIGLTLMDENLPKRVRSKTGTSGAL